MRRRPLQHLQGGRNRNEPVLREDVFLLRVKALGRRANRRPKKVDGQGGDPSAAPEYSSGAGGRSQAELAQHRGLAAVLQPAWKHNPNERKLTRSNRRG